MGGADLEQTTQTLSDYFCAVAIAIVRIEDYVIVFQILNCKCFDRVYPEQRRRAQHDSHTE